MLFGGKIAGHQPRQEEEDEAMSKKLKVAGPATNEEIGAAYQASRVPHERERLLAVTACIPKRRGLHSRALADPHSLPQVPPVGPNSVPPRLHSGTPACTPSRRAHSPCHSPPAHGQASRTISCSRLS